MAARTRYIGVITNKAGKFIKGSPKKNWDWGAIRWMKQQEEWDYTCTKRVENTTQQFENPNYNFRVVQIND